MNQIFKIILFLIDIIFIPLTIISALWLKFVRRYLVGLWSTNGILSKKVLLGVGVFPVLDHYYEPLFNSKHLKRSLRENRDLPGINLNENVQLDFLSGFNFNSDLIEISNRPESILTYSFKRGPFLSGDSEHLFNMVRKCKPKRIIEVGCGASTLMIQHAIEYNKKDNPDYVCKHICIEPYEQDWLKLLPIKLIRGLVEFIDLKQFKKLEKDDILFIDSSHMVRPQGDVLFEYLQILPVLNAGVFVHIHDIFTPKDYLDEWLNDGIMFWNEQYLLEAFLSLNKDYEIVGALNFLKHNHFQKLQEKCPLLTKEREPGSFWIRKAN